MELTIGCFIPDEHDNSSVGITTVVSLMDVDEATGDSGIGLEVAPSDGEERPDESHDRPFRSVTTQSHSSTSWHTTRDTDMTTDTSTHSPVSAVSVVDRIGCSLIGDFIDDVSSLSISATSSTLDLSLPRHFEELLASCPRGVTSATSRQSSSSSSSRRGTASRRRRPRQNGRQLHFDDCSPMSQELLSLSAVSVDSTTTTTTTRKRTRRPEQWNGCVLDGKRSFPVGDGDESPDDEEVTCVSDVINALAHGDDHVRNMIGDLSAEHTLPVVANGKHADLKTITPDTLADVLADRYSHVIEQCFVIDCRYPYEFDGGHIENALNVCSKEAVVETFILSDVYRRSSASGRRTIFVFHCEFSSERAPSLLRFLRNEDRAAHSNCYPRLHYPEIYLLAGGYKAFYESYVALCRPPFYRTMLDSNHAAELRHFRLKSKSWPGVGSKQSQMQQRVVGGPPIRGLARGIAPSRPARADGLSRRKSLWT